MQVNNDETNITNFANQMMLTTNNEQEGDNMIDQSVGEHGHSHGGGHGHSHGHTESDVHSHNCDKKENN